MNEADTLTRVTAALRALAVGDAMGRATEYYEPDEIAEIYEDAIVDFVEPVRLFDEEQWQAGETGPITLAVVAAASAGSAPPAWDSAADDSDVSAQLARGVVLGLRRTLDDPRPSDNGGGPVHAIAAAVAAAVAGYPARDVLAQAARGAEVAADHHLARGIAAAGGIAQESGGRRPGVALRERFPPTGGADTLVPFILGLVYATQSARRAILEAVNQGGHAPETAGVAGAICAAVIPASLPQPWGTEVERINDLDMESAARRYLRLEPAPES